MFVQKQSFHGRCTNEHIVMMIVITINWHRTLQPPFAMQQEHSPLSRTFQVSITAVYSSNENRVQELDNLGLRRLDDDAVLDDLVERAVRLCEAVKDVELGDVAEIVLERLEEEVEE